MKIGFLLALATTVGAAVAQSGFELVDREPEPPLGPGPAFAESYEAALTTARSERRLVLLYFTAVW